MFAASLTSGSASSCRPGRASGAPQNSCPFSLACHRWRQVSDRVQCDPGDPPSGTRVWSSPADPRPRRLAVRLSHRRPANDSSPPPSNDCGAPAPYSAGSVRSSTVYLRNRGPWGDLVWPLVARLGGVRGSCDAPLFSVAADAHAVSGCTDVQMQCSATGLGQPVDQQRFEAGVVGEPFDVAQVRDGGGDVGVQRRVRSARRSAGSWDGGEGGAAQPAGVAAAAGGVELQAVDAPAGGRRMS